MYASKSYKKLTHSAVKFSKAGDTATSTNTQLKRKKVHFRVSRYKYFDAPKNVEPLDVGNLYYTPAELSRLVSETRHVLLSMQRGVQINEEECGECTRGLEDRTYEGARKRVWNQHNAYQAVLREQQRQRECGINDPQKLADAYANSCADTQESAIATARKDSLDLAEEAILKVLEDKKRRTPLCDDDLETSCIPNLHMVYGPQTISSSCKFTAEALALQERNRPLRRALYS